MNNTTDESEEEEADIEAKDEESIDEEVSEVQIRYLSSFSWFGIFLFNSFNYSKRVLTKAINFLSHRLSNSFGSYVIGLGVFRAL
jgi:hypothetical protein